MRTHTYEVYNPATQELRLFEDFDEATYYAENIGIDFIAELGGNFEEFGKCKYCGDWVPCAELDAYDDICERCAAYIASREGV